MYSLLGSQSELITITTTTSKENPIAVGMELDPPTVYLDHGVIGDLTESERGKEFRDVLISKGGTLCVSGLHLVELSGISAGPTYHRIKDYVTTYGRNIAILEYDPGVILEREKSTAEMGRKSCLDFELAIQLIQKWDGLSEINLGILFGILEKHKDVDQSLREAHIQHKINLPEKMLEFTEAYRTDPIVKARIRAIKCPDPGEALVLEYLFCHIRKVCFREGLYDGDAMDLFHSLVSVAYCDFVVLDRKWATRYRKIPYTPGVAKVYRIGEISELIRELAA